MSRRYRFFNCLFLFVGFLNAFPAFSQELGLVKGRVREKGIGTSLPGATVRVAGTTAGCITDIKGDYTLSLPDGPYVILCSYVGMKTDSVSIAVKSGVPAVHDFYLASNTSNLDPVVVSVSRYAQRPEESTVTCRYIRKDQIDQTNCVNVKSVLEQSPAVTILDDEPQIRGGSGFSFGVGSRVATLIDGLPIITGDAGRTDWNFIPTEDIEQIEIIEGASSVLYGSSALNGVINFRTKYPTEKSKTTIRLHSGAYSAPLNRQAKWWNGVAAFAGLNFSHGEKHAKDDFIIGGQFNYDHGFIGPNVPDASSPIKSDTISESEVADKSARLNFNFRHRCGTSGRWSYGIAGNIMTGHTNFSLLWGDGKDNMYRAYPGSMTLNNFSAFYVDPFIDYNSTLGFNHRFRSRIYYTENNNSNDQSNKATVSIAEYSSSKKFEQLGGLNVVGGIYASHTASDADLYAAGGSPENQSDNRAVFVQADKKFFNKLILQGGTRVEYFKINKESESYSPVFRGGVNYEPFKGTNLHASWGQGYRYPTITEKFISTNAGGIAVFPNTALLPESSNSMEIGVRQGFKFGKVMGYVDATAFSQHYTNTIEYIFAAWSPGLSGFKFVNTGKSRVNGIEAAVFGMVDLSVNYSIRFMAGYTGINPLALEPSKVFGVTDPEDGFIPEELTYQNTSSDPSKNRLKYRFRNIVKADIEVMLKKFSPGLEWRCYSFMENIDKAFYDFDSQENTQYPDGVIAFRDKHHGSSSVLNFRCGYRFNNKWTFIVVCNNMLNNEYALRPMKIESPRSAAIQIKTLF